MTKKFFIKSYGCQMNMYDSGRMADALAPLGYVAAAAADDAELVILNTCHIREKAAEKVYSELGRMRDLAARPDRAGGPGMILAVAGCVAQAEGAEILRRAPYVDIVFGPQTYHRLPDLLDRAKSLRRRAPGRGAGIIDTEFPAETKFNALPEASGKAVSAFLTVQEGCDKFCAFCVVPYTRGAESSRPVRDVVSEARGLVCRGARELTLLGQNVNAYHGAAPDGGDLGLGDLIRELAGIEGLERVRYTTSHPRDMDDRLISAHAEVPQLMPYLHLPVQSGSDRVLAAMNRGHEVADYLRIVDRLRQARPDIALSSDFIVGHPGESEEDFGATLDLIDAVGFAQAYSFKFSPRPGTPAAAAEQVPEAARADRLQRIQALLNAQQCRYNDRFVGTVLPILIDRAGGRPGQIAGRSPFMHAVHVECGPGAIADAWGRTLPVRIAGAHANSLSGDLAGPPAAMAPAVFHAGAGSA